MHNIDLHLNACRNARQLAKLCELVPDWRGQETTELLPQLSSFLHHDDHSWAEHASIMEDPDRRPYLWDL